jgi:FK506-binding nuclear protein
MFWGLIMEPGRCYTQKVKVSFHVSMAALDISNSSEEPAQVMCVFEGRNYLLCTLNKKDNVQCVLDLNFESGSKVSFATNGKAHVHLTGYLTNFDDDNLEEVVEEEEETIGKKEKKRLKKESNEAPPIKKVKLAKNSLSVSNVEEEEDSSDSEFVLDELVEEPEEEFDSDADEGEEEEEDEDMDEEEVSDEEVEEDEEEKEEVKPKQNGIAKTNSTPLKKKTKEQKEPEKTPKDKVKKQEEKKEKQQPKIRKTVLKGGVIVEDLKEGSGELVKNGKFVHVYYEGRLKENNKMFDSTVKGPGFSFRVGKGEVIKGWDIGLVGMKVGGKRRITCPPNVAYGPKGSPPVIPPNSTLVFDVQVKKIS